MKDPTRLRDTFGDRSLGAAVRSADEDAPPAGSRDALLASLGIAAGVAALSVAPSALAAGAALGAAETGALASSGGGAVAKLGGLALVAKWVVVSTVIVSGAAATVYSTAAPDAFAPARRTTLPIATPGAPAPLARETARGEPLPVLVPVAISAAPITTSAAPTLGPAPASRITSTKATPPRPMAVASSAPGAPPATSTVPDEILRLDRVRELLAGGRPAEASSDLDAYDRAFPRGVLAQEAEVLRVEALARGGHVDAARRRAREFTLAHPDSPLRARVQNVLAAAGADAASGPE